MVRAYDRVIVGSGIYGMYAAKLVADKGKKALVVECDARPFSRASFVNQARVHNGYHYPRSYSTAVKSARYYDKFCRDFDFAINRRFRKIYAISSRYSLTAGGQFQKFCAHAGIPCEPLDPDKYFRRHMVEAAFETREYGFDAGKICGRLEADLLESGNVEFAFGARIVRAGREGDIYDLTLSNGERVAASGIINCTYASINQVNRLFGFDSFRIKYEIAEIILCGVAEGLRDVGITVMDGPFFSVMPFGDSGLHTLTSVTFTPHRTSYGAMPAFDCQKVNRDCTGDFLQNCNQCPARPRTALPYMRQLSNKYLKDAGIAYKGSLFAIKPILLSSEVDDSRPTLVRRLSAGPDYFAVLSGKINTIYDMEGVVI